MKIKRKTFVGGLLAALCACTALTFGAVFSSSGTKVASAASAPIGELVLSDTNGNYVKNKDGKIMFDSQTLARLYGAITGDSSGKDSYKSVQTLVSSGDVDSTGLSSNGLTVTFGGYEWYAVYLTTASQEKYVDATDTTITTNTVEAHLKDNFNSSGKALDSSVTVEKDDVVLTLMLADVAKNGGTAITTEFSKKTASTYPTAYPSSMYGSSYLRSVTVNAGSGYTSTASAATLTTGSQNASSMWADFTMPGTQNSLTDYIVQPQYIAYQYDENQQQYANSADYVLPGEALGVPLKTTSVKRWGGASSSAASNTDTRNFGYATQYDTYYNPTVDKVSYYGWKNDYLWVPSLAEFGQTKGTDNTTTNCLPGIWKLSVSQRNASKDYWTRSAGSNSIINVRSINATGGMYAPALNTSAAKCAIRPALHLNLTKAEEATKLDAPSDIATTKAYDGTAQALTYNGTQHNIKYLAPDWYTDEIYSDTDLMEVTYEHIARGDTTSTFAKPQISGGSVDDGINSSLTVDPSIAANIKNAGKYKVTLKTKPDGLKWKDDTTDYDTATAAQKELAKYRVVEYEIAPKKVNVSYSIYDTSGASPVEKSGTSVVYTTDTTKTYKVDIKTTVSTESIPTGTPATLFPDYEIVYSGTANDGTTTYTKTTTPPRLAGSYKAEINDKNSKTSNYELKCAQTAFSYTVDKAEVSLPTFSVDKLTYNANEQDFVLTSASYDTAILKVNSIQAGSVALTANEAGTEYESADGYFVVKYDAVNKKFTATNAADYKVTFALVDTNNYTWATALSSTEKAKTFKVEKKELVIKFKSPLSNTSNFNLKTSTTGNVTADYDTNGGGEIPAGGSAEEPILVLYYTFSDGSSTGSKVLVGTSSGDSIGNFSLDVTTLKGVNSKFSAGTYTLEFELAPETANAVNKNYKLGTSAAQALTVTAGEASIDDIGILYNTVKKEADGEPAAAIPSDGLTYEYDSVSKQATEYKFELDFSNIDYLTYAGTAADSISLQYNNDSTAVHAINAGKLTVTVKIKVKDDEAANHALPAAFDVTQTNTFKSYLNNGDGTATITFEIEINKHEITVNGSDIPLKYQREGGQVTDYDPKNPPEFNGKPITISLPHESLYPHGIKEIVFDEATPKKTQAGSYTIGATVTLDDNHCLANGSNTLHVDIPWEISKEVIKLAWGKPVYFDDYFNDGTVAHLQVMLLSGLTEAQEGAIKYSFYKDLDGAPLSDAELKALCTNDRFTDPNETWLYVKAELTEDGAKKYKLEDDATKNPKRFKLGGQMTLIELKVDDKINGYEYGGELDLSKVFTLINTETGDPWDSSYYEIRVLKDGVDIGELSEFNPAVNGAGKYVIQINIKPEYAEDYTLDKSNKVDFEIHRKEIAAPTVGNILFSGEYINLADYLGGSYAEYKDIISLSGDYQDLRNVSQSGYKARLTLTDPNYKWAQPTAAEPASLKLFAAKLFDNGIAIVDDAIAELKWNITPLVIDATEMWAKGKNGATLNLPESITKLITAETLSVGYKYYDDADQYIETPELKGGKSFRVEAVFGGIDAESGNVVFKTADGNFGAVSDKISYTVPQSGAAAFFGSTLNFLKANWLWLVIAAVALLFLIILICIIVSAKKKKRKKEELEEQRRLEKEEREREERKLEREERMARLNQQQSMPQMMMPQMMQMPQMPQMMQPQMPQQQPQYAPQQPMMAGGASSNEIAELKAEISAMKAEAAAKESAALRAEVMRAEQAAMKAEQNAVLRSDVNAIRSGEQFTGINMDAMTEIMTRALKNVLASAAQPVVTAPPAQPAQLTDGSSSTATANAVYPPDAVMTTVTTTKIDTTKKQPQAAQNAPQAAPGGRTIVRNIVAPMPVDDGRIFDVGGFYKPADPVDMGFEEEDKKD